MLTSPGIISGTKKVFDEFDKNILETKVENISETLDVEQLLHNGNDLEPFAINIYPEIKKLLYTMNKLYPKRYNAQFDGKLSVVPSATHREMKNFLDVIRQNHNPKNFLFTLGFTFSFENFIWNFGKYHSPYDFDSLFQIFLKIFIFHLICKYIFFT